MVKSDSGYYYFFFEPFDKRETLTALGDVIPSGMQQLAYDAWLEWYHFHADLFYYDQYWQHTTMVYYLFTRKHQLPDDGGESIGESEPLQELYDKAQYEAGTDRHHDRYHAFLEHIKTAYPLKPKYTSLVVTASEMMDEFLEEMSGKPTGQSYINKITEAWFNIRISNTAKQIKQLRAMPYPEYLKTEHWYKVRALTLFVYRALCGSTECQGHGDQMWIHYANHRQVHHISYANRGNERFGDVCVLCNECHTKIHNGRKDLLDADSTYILF